MEMRTSIVTSEEDCLTIRGEGVAVSAFAMRGRVQVIAAHLGDGTYPVYPSDQVFAQCYGKFDAILRVMGESDLDALVKASEVATCR